MRVSVIVPNYNHAPFLRQRLQTVYDQTFRDFELIILDDCSTDQSAEVIDEAVRANAHLGIPTRVSVNDANTGSPFRQWRKGIEMARGEYIWLAESDDWADPGLLEALVGYSDAHHLALCFCQSNFVDTDGNPVERYTDGQTFYRADRVFDARGMMRYVVGENMVPNASAVIFRRSEALRWLDTITAFRYCGDWALWGLIITSGARCGYLSTPYNYFRRHPGATTTTGQKSRDFMLEQLRVVALLKDAGVYGPDDPSAGETAPVKKEVMRQWVVKYVLHCRYSLRLMLSHRECLRALSRLYPAYPIVILKYWLRGRQKTE